VSDLADVEILDGIERPSLTIGFIPITCGTAG
jgi:hypothetical protein